MSGYMTNFPFGIKTTDSALEEGEGAIKCLDLDVTGGVSIVPTISGNAIQVQPAANSAGDQFIYVGNSGGTGAAGHTCGFKTGSYNGGEIGLISNGDDVAYNGLPANTCGMYLTDKDFSITSNGGSGSTYTSLFSIDNSTGYIDTSAGMTVGDDLTCGGFLTCEASNENVGLLVSTNQGLRLGLVHNASGSAVNGIPDDTNGIFVTDDDFYITTNNGSGSTYSTALSISNTTTGGVNIATRTSGMAALAGFVGYFQSGGLAEGSAASLSTDGTYSVLATISLAPGNYIASANLIFVCNGVSGSSVTCFGGFGPNSSGGSDLTLGANANTYSVTGGATDLGSIPVSVPFQQVSVDTTTNYYLKAAGTNFTGTLQVYGTVTFMVVP